MTRLRRLCDQCHLHRSHWLGRNTGVSGIRLQFFFVLFFVRSHVSFKNIKENLESSFRVWKLFFLL